MKQTQRRGRNILHGRTYSVYTRSLLTHTRSILTHTRSLLTHTRSLLTRILYIHTHMHTYMWVYVDTYMQTNTHTTCVCMHYKGHNMCHMRRRIHVSYEEKDTCVVYMHYKGSTQWAYSVWLIFFSARTNKRHDHHHTYMYIYAYTCM